MSFSTEVRAAYRQELDGILAAGLFEEERHIHSAQDAEIEVEYPAGAPPRRVVNLCSNNYLGLSSHPEVVAAAVEGLRHRGYGLSSVRFICGTQYLHRRLEAALTEFLGTEDTLLFPSCLDANAGVFETLLGDKDVMIADRLVHASIVDGMRLCKALGGASGGCVSGPRELVAICRQRTRPYLFSNTVQPVIVAGALKVLELVSHSTERRDRLEENTVHWRRLLTEAGFDLKPGTSSIVPVMLYNAKLAQDVARDLFGLGVYVVGFFFPVVAKGQARIRTQLSAAHTRQQLDRAAAAFIEVGRRYDILGKRRKEIVAMYGE